MAKGRIEHEKKVITRMIEIYCKGHHHDQSLCPKCTELTHYAHQRLDRCPFGEDKGFCSSCSIHCYQREKRAAIKDVMRYAGPRMLIYHPLTAVKHLLLTSQR